MAGREWTVALMSDGETGAVIADFTDRPAAERPSIGAGETAEIEWDDAGMFRLRIPEGGGHG